MKQAELSLVQKEQASFEQFLREADYEALKLNTVYNDLSSCNAFIESQTCGVGITISDIGFCPNSCSGCINGEKIINNDNATVSYGPVDGYPEKNCVRCRWFITGPAFLSGLVHHFNCLAYSINENGKRMQVMQSKLEQLENRKFICEKEDRVFSEENDLKHLETAVEKIIIESDKLANDYNYTLTLIDKCIKLANSNNNSSSLSLVANGSEADIRISLNDVKSDFEQLQVICNGAELFFEDNVSKAVLQRSQIIDSMLINNNHTPIMLSLTEEEQLLAGNQLIQLLIKRAGSIKNVVPYAEGRKKLSELGFDFDANSILTSISINNKNIPMDVDKDRRN